MQRKRAFSLLELAIALMITGMVAGMVMKLSTTTDRNECYAASKAQVTKIKEAIDRFALSNRRFPLPARRYVGTDSPLYGKEVKPGEITDLDSVTNNGTIAVFGTVPYAALGLTMDDAIDCWGNRLTYVVTEALTNQDGFTNETEGAITISVAQNARISTKEPGTPDGFGYAVIVHGEDQLGAVKANWSDYTAATPLEAERLAKRKWCDADGTLKTPNCLASNANLMAAPFNNGDDPATYFDDVIIWRGKPWRAGGGNVYCWGWAANGQLGNGSNSGIINKPVAVTGIDGTSKTAINFKAIVLLSNSSCGIDNGGLAYCWGDGQNGKLGNGNPADSSKPVKVFGPDGTDQNPLKFKQIKGHTSMVCGLTEAGKIYCWGQNNGRYGDGITTSSIPVAAAQPLNFESFIINSSSMCGLTSGHQIYCWGRNVYGILGNASIPISPPSAALQMTPVLVDGNISFQSFATHEHTNSFRGSTGTRVCALDINGYAYCWGLGTNYSLLGNNITSSGDGSNTNSNVPTPVVGPDGSLVNALRFRSLSMGSYTTCGITLPGASYCWGSGGGDRLDGGGANNAGLLGTGAFGSSKKPVQVAAPTQGLSTIYAYGAHDSGWGAGPPTDGYTGDSPSCGLATDNVAYCWGTAQASLVGNTGMLGSLGSNRRLAPTPVAGPNNTFQSLHITNGAYSVGGIVCGLTTEGKAYCWGHNQYGRLGNNGGSVVYGTPQPVLGPDGTIAKALSFKTLETSNTHVCGITR